MLLRRAQHVAGRWIALAATILTLILSLALIANFDTGTANFQFTETSVDFALPRELCSGWMASRCAVVLTRLSLIFVVIAGWSVIEVRAAQYLPPSSS